MSELVMKERISVLKDKMLSEKRYASIEQAKIITDTYKQHEDEPRIMQRAYSLKNCLEKINISVEPEEMIVGNRTAGVRYGVVFPESGSTWVDKEFETLPTRPQDKFNVHEEDISYFREVIYPYWQGKSLEDVLRARYGKEIDEIAKIVKINQKDHAQGHINPDCKGWLEKGPAGLKAESDDHYNKETDEEKKLFYKSVSTVMEGVINFIMRYHDLCLEKANEYPEYADNMKKVAENCKNIAERPAQNFHEANQAIWFLFVILQMESNASSFSPGRKFSQRMNPNPSGMTSSMPFASIPLSNSAISWLERPIASLLLSALAKRSPSFWEGALFWLILLFILLFPCVWGVWVLFCVYLLSYPLETGRRLSVPLLSFLFS